MEKGNPLSEIINVMRENGATDEDIKEFGDYLWAEAMKDFGGDIFVTHEELTV